MPWGKWLPLLDIFYAYINLRYIYIIVLNIPQQLAARNAQLRVQHCCWDTAWCIGNAGLRFPRVPQSRVPRFHPPLSQQGARALGKV